VITSAFIERAGYIVEPAMETASGTGVEISDSILDAVGDTPLVRLSRLGRDLRPQLVAKIEARSRTAPRSL
jgi:hypothetical protein